MANSQIVNIDRYIVPLRFLFLVAFVTGITLLHYFTPINLTILHDIFQRLYYIPIILASFWFGLRGGMFCAVTVSTLYVPHILFQWGGHLPMDAEKYLEIVLYNVVGGVTGFLCEKERLRSHQLKETAHGLEMSYEKMKKQSERIMEIEGQLREAERLSTIGEVAAVMAHEIRNPLGSIKGTAEILMDDYGPGNKKYEFLQILIKESDRLSRVIEDFLRLSRPQPLVMQICDLGEELQNIITLVSAEAKKKDVALELSFLQMSSTIHADPEKLRQAFLNIVLNGLQATPPGGSIHVTSSSHAAEDGKAAWKEVRFTDSGPGIAAEVKDKIFEPFFTTKEGGTGLGLAITKKIIETHGGTITVKSDPGTGTEFIVRLPENI